MHEVRAYALAAVFFLAAPASQAGLPSHEYLAKELYDDEQARLYGQPLDLEAARQVVVTNEDRADDDRTLTWTKFDQTGVGEIRSNAVISLCSETQPCRPWKLGHEWPNPNTWRLASGVLTNHFRPAFEPLP
jgi:hypothetical protein